MKWNLNLNEIIILVKLLEDVFFIDMYWFSKLAVGGGVGKKGLDLFVFIFIDGNFNKIFVGLLIFFKI